MALPRGLSGGLSKEVESPIYATGVGLILHRAKELNTFDKQFSKSKSGKLPQREKVTAKSGFYNSKKMV